MDVTQEQLDYLRKCHVQVALPMYGGMCFESVMVGMVKFALYCSKIGMHFSMDTMVNESLITRGRNNLVAKFMENQTATHLLWIDSDIGFEPEQIFQLLMHDKDVVGGLYPKKTLPIDFVVNVEKESVGEDGRIATQGALIPVSRTGTGFMLIKRHVFDKMFAAYPQLKFTGNIGLDIKYDPFMYALFDTAIDPETLEYLSEDYVFCKRWKELGGEIWADSSIRLAHSGFFKFPGNPKELMTSLGLPLDSPLMQGRISINPSSGKQKVIK